MWMREVDDSGEPRLSRAQDRRIKQSGEILERGSPAATQGVARGAKRVRDAASLACLPMTHAGKGGAGAASLSDRRQLYARRADMTSRGAAADGVVDAELRGK